MGEVKLKTLRDIRCWCFMCVDDESRKEEYPQEIKVEDLRQEAIKHIKFYLNKIECSKLDRIEEDELTGHSCYWRSIKGREMGVDDDHYMGMVTAYVDFFNITDEELK